MFIPKYKDRQIKNTKIKLNKKQERGKSNKNVTGLCNKNVLES